MMKQGPTEKDLERAASLFKALSHPDRLRLACLLVGREGATQKELVRELGWPQSTVARHLGALRGEGLVTGTRDGVEVRLAAATLPRLLLDGICDWLGQAPADAGQAPADAGQAPADAGQAPADAGAAPAEAGAALAAGRR